MATGSAMLVAAGSLVPDLLLSVIQRFLSALSKTSYVAGLKTAIVEDPEAQLSVLRKQCNNLDAFIRSAESLDLLHNSGNDMLVGWVNSVIEADEVGNNLIADFSRDMKTGSKLLSLNRKLHDFNLKNSKIYTEATRIGLSPIVMVANPAIYHSPSAMPMSTDEIRKNVDTSIVVGREADENLIVRELCGVDNCGALGIIAMVGMSGVGKTTLARKIYDNAEVTDHYSKKTWISVSKDFNLILLLKEMLQTLTGKEHKLSNTGAIEGKIRGCLRKKRYLLVLDDMLNTEHHIWGLIRTSLLSVTKDCKSSMLLVTTQSDVLKSVMSANVRRTVQNLSKDDAWVLFQELALANKSGQQKAALKDIGERILSKCGGLPLAINRLGYLLRSMNEIREWESVEKRELWQDQTDIMPWLLSSFNHRPITSSVKQCFAHCAVVIPKGGFIEYESLIYYWIAQGYIRPSERSHQRFMEIGRSYIKSMLSIGLLQSRDRGHNLHMHDLMHDLARYISYKKNLVIREGSDLDPDKSSGVEHVSILGCDIEKSLGCDSGKSLYTFLKGSPQGKLRTLLCLDFPISLNFLGQERLLRTLVLKRCGLKEIPESIGRLKHLRILHLCDNPLEYLPKTIGDLYNLQVLDLRNCIKLVELPTLGCLHSLQVLNIDGLESVEDIGDKFFDRKAGSELTSSYFPRLRKFSLKNMPKLKHLSNPHASSFPCLEELCITGCPLLVELPPTIRRWSSLRYLKISRCDSLTALPDIKDMLKLRSLVIMNCKNVAEAPHGLATCVSIEVLDLLQCPKLNSIPDLRSLTRLRKLDTGGFNEKLDHFHGIGTLPSSLRGLGLYGWANLKSLPDKLQSLTQLERLSLFDFKGVEKIPRWVTKISSLESLELDNCKNMKYLPTMHSLTRLRKLEIKDCPLLKEKHQKNELKVAAHIKIELK